MTVEVGLWLVIGILAGFLLAALKEVGKLHRALFATQVVAHERKERLRAERHTLIHVRDVLLRKICSISERSGELEELAHALAQLAPLREIRETQSEFGRLRDEGEP